MANEVIAFLSVLAGIIIIGYCAEIIFKKTRIPDVLILMFLGIFLSALGLIDSTQFGFTASLFTTFTLVFLLFQGALNIEFKTLQKALKGTLKLTITSFMLTTIAVTLSAFIFLQYNFLTALLIGTILSGTSSAVVIPIVANLRANKRISSILTLESALSDVFTIVGTVTILAILIEGNVSPTTIVQNVVGSFILALAIGAALGLMWIITLRQSKHLMDSYMVTIAVVIGLYALVESPFIGASGAIAVLAFGLMMGNAKTLEGLFKVMNGNADDTIMKRNVLSHSARNFYEEISFFVKVFFFVYLGILFDFSQLVVLAFGLLITITVYAARIPTVWLAFRGEKLDHKSEALLRYLVPKGLAAAVLAQLALEKQIPFAEDIVNLIFAVILISIIMTSTLIFLIDKKVPIPHFTKEKETRTRHKREQDAQTPEHEHDLPALRHKGQMRG